MTAFTDFLSYITSHPIDLNVRQPRLTDDLSKELFELFDSAGLPDKAMSLEMADGYLTACVVGPQPTPTSYWLEGIFGQPNLPICANPAQQNRIIELLRLRYLEIDATTAIADPGAPLNEDYFFFPLIADVPEEEIIHPYQLDDKGNRQGNWVAKDWATGFRNAMFEDVDSNWGPLLEDEEDWALIAFVMLHEQGFNAEKPEFQLEAQEDALGALAISAPAIRSFWRNFNRHAAYGRALMEQELSLPYFRDTPKIGRNDPCHCGSGKKFKKCHGA